jgi:GntR family transcriptional repressor for pyruvate dehydrogenase complex
MSRCQADELFGSPAGKIPAYRQAVDRIRRAIQLGQFEQGERLPTETEIAEQLGLSRVTVREAVRQLEGEGLVEIRRGARGGLFVRPHDKTKALPLAQLLKRWKDIEDLFEFRVGVGMGRRSSGGCTAHGGYSCPLAVALEGFRTGEKSTSFRRADSAIHLAIADAADNAYLREAIEEARVGMFLPFDVLAVAPTS